MSDLKKRSFVKSGLKTAFGLAAAGGVASVAPTVFAKSKYQATMVTSWPGVLTGFWDPINEFCKSIYDITDGQFHVEAVKPGELVGGLEVYDAVSSGAAQMGHTASYYYLGKSPIHALFTTVPYGMSQPEGLTWALQDKTVSMYRDFLKQDNMTWFPCFGTGTQMGGWFRKEINSVADLKGLKMRIPGLGGKAMAKLGVNVQVLAGGDIYPSLERGAIDATEWVGPHDDLTFGFDKIAQYYYHPGWHEPGGMLSCYANLDFYRTLPEQYQLLLEQMNKSSSLVGTYGYVQKNAVALEKMLSKGKVQVKEFPMDVQVALKKASESVINSYVNSDSKFAEFWDYYKSSMNSYRKALSISDYSYQCNSIKLAD